MGLNNKKLSDLFNQAIEDGRNRNYQSAVKKLRTILSATDKLPDALLYLGRAQHELGNHEDAVLSFRMYITGNPKSGPGYFYLGRTYIAVRRYQRAVNCFSEAVRNSPDFAPALAYLGYSLMRCGSAAKSVEYLGRAAELEPDNRRIFAMYINSIMMYSMSEFRNENYSKALDGFMFIEDAGCGNISTLLYAGISLKELKRYKEAGEYLEKALAMEPGDELIRNILAELYIHQSRIDEAIEVLAAYRNEEQIISFLEGIEELSRNLAVSYWNKKEYGNALHFALASLKQKRTAEMHLLAGECNKFRERYEHAYNHFERAQSLEPGAVEPLYGKATVCWLRKDFSGMLEVLEAILDKDSGDNFAHYYRVLCSAQLGHPYHSWKDELEQLLNEGKDAWLYNAKGRGELSEGKQSNAASAFRNAIDMDGELRDAWLGLIESLESAKTSQLLTVLKKYLDGFDSDNSIRRRYAGILLQEEKYSAAAKQFKILSSAADPDAGSLKRYAYCSRMAGNYREAALLYRQLLAIDPYNENLLKLLLYCMRMDGKETETIPLLRAAVEEFKQPSADLLLVYGSTLYRSGAPEEALSVFQKCIYRGFSDWRIYRNMAIIYRKKGMTEWAEMYEKKAEKIKKN